MSPSSQPSIAPSLKPFQVFLVPCLESKCCDTERIAPLKHCTNIKQLNVEWLYEGWVQLKLQCIRYSAHLPSAIFNLQQHADVPARCYNNINGGWDTSSVDGMDGFTRSMQQLPVDLGTHPSHQPMMHMCRHNTSCHLGNFIQAEL